MKNTQFEEVVRTVRKQKATLDVNYSNVVMHVDNSNFSNAAERYKKLTCEVSWPISY